MDDDAEQTFFTFLHAVEELNLKLCTSVREMTANFLFKQLFSFYTLYYL